MSWWFRKVLTLQLFLQVGFEAWNTETIIDIWTIWLLELQMTSNCHWREIIIIIIGISTALPPLRRQPAASPWTGSTSPPALAMAEAWIRCSRTAAAPWACPELPSSSRTGRDRMPPLRVPEYTYVQELHELLLWDQNLWNGELQVAAVEWHAFMLTHLLPWVTCSGQISTSSVTCSPNMKPLQAPWRPQLFCLLLLLKIHSPSGVAWMHESHIIQLLAIYLCSTDSPSHDFSVVK